MYKTQIACIIYILFIGILYFSSFHQKSESSRWFSRLMVCSLFQLIFDMISVYTVNHLDTVPVIVNRIVHIFFMVLLLSLFYIVYNYLETMIEEEIGKRIRRNLYSGTLLIATTLGVTVLPLDYMESAKSNYAYGAAYFMTYAGVAIYVFLIIKLIIQYGKRLPRKKKITIYIALLGEFPVAVYQILIPDSLITCIGIGLINLGFYMTTENPDAFLAEQLEKEKRRADMANEAKTNFLANMSHEIRTPITAVLGMNELILRESVEPAIKQYAQDIEGAAKSLLSIINDILDITKIEAGKLRVISAEYSFFDVVKDVTNMITFKAKVKNLEFLVSIDENIPEKLMGDDVRLRQILVNLLNNAVKYTHQGTVSLTIELLPSETEGMAAILFSVKDTGIGIKEADMQKLCMPFERIEEKRNRNIEGTGLGMSITKQLLELLGSELKVSSVYGSGSVFSFTLHQEITDAKPIGSVTEHMNVAQETYQHTYEAPDARILIVDDNELNRRVFIGLLKSIKIQIDEAKDGKECLKKVMQQSYDIIFMDHMMPEMDGIETFHAMKNMDGCLSKETPVVILTANAIVGAKERYLEEGFSAFLEKPIDYQKLENLIRELLEPSLICPAKAPLPKKAFSAEELPLVEGLDWKYANLHFCDMQTMLETVEFFVDSVLYDADELERLFSEIETETGRKEYCTKVHSMKNSASTIGIIPLAGMAKVLEDAARNADVAVLKSMTPVFLKCWRAYKEKLVMFSESQKKENKKRAEEYQKEIEELLEQIRTAAEEMDIDALDESREKLGKYQFDNEKQKVAEEICRAIVNFDIDYLMKASL